MKKNGYTLELQTKSRKTQNWGTLHPNRKRSNIDMEVLARVAIIPQASDYHTCLSAWIYQKILATGKCSVQATLTFRAIIPSDSEIFSLIREGNLDGVRKMIEGGQVKVNDTDPDGQTIYGVSPLF